MRISISSPIPGLGSIPGPSRPGYGPSGSYDFQFEVTGAVTIKANAAGAGNFRVSWPNGTTQVLSGNNASVAAPDGTAGIVSINNEKLDDTYCDEFAVVGGQTNVSKVISWGANPWSNMTNAFNGCTSLSDISTTSFISSAQGDMVTMFNGCTSLLEADIRNWDLSAGADWYLGSPFKGLANLQKLDMTGMNIKLINRSDSGFVSIGTAATNGCEFLMSGINWSTSTSAIWTDFLAGVKINPNSTFANWVFPSSSVSINRMLRGATISGVNSTLNVSGWSTFSGGGIYQVFQNFNSADSPNTDQGVKINISNINLSNVSDFRSMFEGSDVSEIIGLSTLGACAGNANLNKFMTTTSFLKLSSSDNFSNTFISSLNPVAAGISEAFKYCGSSVSSNFGVAPNLTNIDLSNVTGVNSTFEGARFYDAPDLSTATFPSTDVEFSKTFKAMRTENSNTHVDFSNVSVKISYAREMFNGVHVDNVTFGNNVDFSPCTDVYRKFYYSSSKSGTINITYPTAESGLSWAALNQPLDWFKGTTGPTTGPLTTCQVDNLIRSFYNTALNSGLSVNFGTSQITESPSVVSTMIDELENTGGWNITPNTLDATMPFAYPSYSFDSEVTQSVTPTTIPTGGQFSSTDPGVTVNASTGVVSWDSTYMGLPIIRCTYADGCYNEVQMSMIITVDNNYSMAFDGSSSYININSLASTLGSEGSFSAWVNVSDWSSRAAILGFAFDADNFLRLGIRTNNNNCFSIGGQFNNVANEVISDTTSLSENVWYHVVATSDGSVYKLYVNGQLQTLTILAGSNNGDWVSDFSSTANKGTIGSLNRTGSSEDLFNGKIDELGVFNRELTAAQIKLIYDANSTNKAIKLSSLPGGAPVAWYRMGD